MSNPSQLKLNRDFVQSNSDFKEAGDWSRSSSVNWKLGEGAYNLIDLQCWHKLVLFLWIELCSMLTPVMWCNPTWRRWLSSTSPPCKQSWYQSCQCDIHYSHPLAICVIYQGSNLALEQWAQRDIGDWDVVIHTNAIWSKELGGHWHCIGQLVLFLLPECFHPAVST